MTNPSYPCREAQREQPKYRSTSTRTDERNSYHTPLATMTNKRDYTMRTHRVRGDGVPVPALSSAVFPPSVRRSLGANGHGVKYSAKYCLYFDRFDSLDMAGEKSASGVPETKLPVAPAPPREYLVGSWACLRTEGRM